MRDEETIGVDSHERFFSFYSKKWNASVSHRSTRLWYISSFDVFYSFRIKNWMFTKFAECNELRARRRIMCDICTYIILDTYTSSSLCRSPSRSQTFNPVPIYVAKSSNSVDARCCISLRGHLACSTWSELCFAQPEVGDCPQGEHTVRLHFAGSSTKSLGAL